MAQGTVGFAADGWVFSASEIYKFLEFFVCVVIVDVVL